MRQRTRERYRLHLMTSDGIGSNAGTFPSRETAEALGEALRDTGCCSWYDVEVTE